MCCNLLDLCSFTTSLEFSLSAAVWLKAFYGRKPQGLNGALQEVGITFEGREHSGTVCILSHSCLRSFYCNCSVTVCVK